MTKRELNDYMTAPTAKAIIEKNKTEGICAPSGGSLSKENTNAKDLVSISKEGMELQKENAANKVADIRFSLTKTGENSFRIGFSNSVMLHRAVKQGFLEIDGKRLELTEDLKKGLLASDEKIRKERETIVMKNMLMQMAASNRQTSDAMAIENAKMSRAMKTAARIMHGRKVSSADERELMELNNDLYAMAKNAAALEKHRRSKKDDEEDEKISRENDIAREAENAPRDYSVEEIEIPNKRTEFDVSFDGDLAVTDGVGEALFS